jgi:hypothetical protein
MYGSERLSNDRADPAPGVPPPRRSRLSDAAIHENPGQAELAVRLDAAVAAVAALAVVRETTGIRRVAFTALRGECLAERERPR